ncbi:hypothetical protein [Parapedobacter sp. SGR-10]|nr:hypothetical protein [Parapedobacter sp. SGR-10]
MLIGGYGYFVYIDGTPAKITEQAGYMVNKKAVDGKMEIYFTDKK